MSGMSDKVRVILVNVVYRCDVCLPTNLKYVGLVKYVAKKFNLEGEFNLSYKLVSNDHLFDITDDDEVSFFITELINARERILELFVVQPQPSVTQGNACFSQPGLEIPYIPSRTQYSEISTQNVALQNPQFSFQNHGYIEHFSSYQNSHHQTQHFEINNKFPYDNTISGTSLRGGSGDGGNDGSQKFEFNWQKDTFTFMPEPLSDPIPDLKEKKCRNYNSQSVVQTGQWFANKKECKLHIATKAIHDGYEFKVRKSCPNRYDVVCVYPECKWKIISNKIFNGDAFVIGTLNDIHTCPKTQTHPNHRNATKEVLGHIIKEQLTDSSRVYRGKEIQKDINNNYKIQISYQQAWRGKAHALQLLQGSPEESFLKLPYYCHNLKLTNPGSMTHIETDHKGRFEMLFVAIGVAIRSFINHLRPLIIIDGAHLKGPYEGTNLLAVGMDGNNQILPIAYGVCKGETGEAWTWFLTKLKECIGDNPNLVIISDRHASIALAIREVFPNAFHGICCRHLEGNIKLKSKKIKALYWKICKAYTVHEFDKLMCQLYGAQTDAFHALQEADVSRWSRAHCPANRYNYLTSNSAESMNALTKNSRKLPITMLIEFFRAMVQRWYYERRQKGEQLQQHLTEWAANKVEDRVQKSATWTVYGIDETHYQVNDRRNIYLVDLRNQTCGCRKWQLSGLPCGHVISVLRFLGHRDSIHLVQDWFKTPKYQATYKEPIFFVGEASDWEIPEDLPTVLPPTMDKRRAGRPKNKDRIPSQGEGPIIKQCSRCGLMGHNRTQCQAPLPSQSISRHFQEYDSCNLGL